jgi:DNA-binding FadR family transcriptional regulator
MREEDGTSVPGEFAAQLGGEVAGRTDSEEVAARPDGRALPAHGRGLAELILAAAERGGAGPGTRLPTERQLAADFGVTRTAVRHAMAMLEAEGRVSREVGRGTFLQQEAAGAAPPAAATAGSGGAVDPVGPLGPAGAQGPAGPGAQGDFAPADVMAVRRLIEPQAMPLVVAWATARDLAEMERCLHGGDRASGYEEFETWDAALHRCIIAASHSPLLVRLYADVEAARHGKVWGDLKRRSASADRREEYQQDHREIVEALRLRDAEGAAAAMRTHLGRVSRHLLGGE